MRQGGEGDTWREDGKQRQMQTVNLCDSSRRRLEGNAQRVKFYDDEKFF